MYCFTSKIYDHMTLRSVIITSATGPKSPNKVELESCRGMCLHSEYKHQTIKITESRRGGEDLQASCVREQG